MKLKILVAVISACALRVAAQPPPNPIPVVNPSFENYIAPWTHNDTTGSYNYGVVPGWTLSGTGTSGQQEPSAKQFAPPPTVPDGVVCWRSNGQTLSQNLNVALSPYTSYVFQVYTAGNRLDNYGINAIWTMSLLAGATVLNSVSGNTGNVPPGTWAQQTLIWQTGQTPPQGNLTIALSCNTTQCNFDMVTVTQQPIPLTIVAPIMPTGAVGVPYAYQFEAVSGTPPYTFSVATGALPPGLTLSSTGALTGTPTTWGLSQFVLAVVDSSSTMQQRASRGIGMGVNQRTTIPVTTPVNGMTSTPIAMVVGDTVTLKWVAGQPNPADPNLPVTGYNVYRRDGSAYNPVNQIAVNVQGLTYKDVGVAPNYYLYLVTSVDAGGNESQFSNGASVQPASFATAQSRHRKN